MAGLARDGGLYVPSGIPRLSTDEIARLAGLPYEQMAYWVMRPYIGDCFADGEFRRILSVAYSGFSHTARAPVVQLNENHFLLELFHGPTLAFKDFAMQLVGRMFQAVLGRRGERVTVVGATSGDTGSAAIEAFGGLDNVNVFILFPDGRVSDVQRRQMTTAVDGNVHALAVNGSFDDCQARVKDLFNDPAFRDETDLAAVNSINWARVLAQVVYYFHAATVLGAPHRKIAFTVPTGNFGDIFAGYIAWRMGLPIERLTVATNRNDILHRCLSGRGYRREEVMATISPSMDIQVSSNFERALFFACGRNADLVRALMERVDSGGFDLEPAILDSLHEVYDSGCATEDETRAAIGACYSGTGRLICPHTAVAVKVAGERRDSTVPVVTLATAHPAKFPDAVERATGIRPALPAHLADLHERPERMIRIGNDVTAIKACIRGSIGR